MRRLFTVLLIQLLCCAALAQSAPGSLFAALAVTEGGDTLVNVNSRSLLVPASNMKVVTTGAALCRLGSGWRWETRLGYSGEVRDGVLHGDLYIIGGADPLLGACQSFAAPLDKVFESWAALVRDAGIRRIEGSVIGDGRWLDGPLEDPTWSWEDIGTYYGAGVSGLSFYENRKDFIVSPGAEEGDSLAVVQGFPDTPWMEYRLDCLTGRKGSGDQLYLYTSRLAPVGSLTGTFAQGRERKTVRCSNKFPELTCAHLFRRHLEGLGITSLGIADAGSCFSAGHPVPQEELTIIGSTASAPLSAVIRETNFESDNFMAETLFRTLGKVCCGDGSFDGAKAALASELRALGIDPSSAAAPLRIADGSGLSRRNYASPAFFCAFLRAMMSTSEYSVFLESLPVAGRSGTARPRLAQLPAGERARVHLKSGSMDGVRCFCGYITPRTAPDGSTLGETIVFSYMVNSSTAPVSRQNADADAFIASLVLR